MQTQGKDLGFFGRYLTVWASLCIVAGVALGQLLPVVPETLSRFVSVVLYIVIPLVAGVWVRRALGSGTRWRRRRPSCCSV